VISENYKGIYGLPEKVKAKAQKNLEIAGLSARNGKQ